MDDSLLKSGQLTISFTSADVHKVDRLEHHLNGLGIKMTRYDRDLKSQENIQIYMERMLEADKIIILLSTAYLKSSFCVFELMHLKNVESKLIRVYADDREPDFFKVLNKAAAVWKKKKEAAAPADWLEREIERQDLDEMFYEIENIYKLKYIRYEELFEIQGERQFLESLSYTPEKYVKQLNDILEKELWTEREFEFDAYLKGAPANDVFYLKKALSYEKENYLEAAVYFLQKSILLNDRFLPAYLELCRIYLLHSEKKGLFDRQQLQKPLTYEEEFAVDSRKLIYKVQGMLNYNDAKLTASREERERFAGQAILWFQKVEELDQEDCTVFNNKGLAYEILGKIAMAAQSYERAIVLNPQYYQAYNNLALLYSKYLKAVDSAIQFYRRCLEIKPDYRYALNGLAILLEQKNIDEAVELYLRLICKEVTHTEELTNLGLIFEEEKGDNRIAACIYKIALEKDPHSVPKNFNYGNLLRKTGAAAGLVEQYLGYALEKLPDSSMTNFSYGLFLLRESEFVRAEEYFNKAYQMNGIFQPAYCMLKYLERARGKDVKKLIKEIERETADYEEVYPLIFNYLGVLYRKIGAGEKAESYIKKGRELDPRLKSAGDDLDMNYLELTYKLWTEDRIYKNRPVNAAYDRDRQICEEINARMFSAGLL